MKKNLLMRSLIALFLLLSFTTDFVSSNKKKNSRHRKKVEDPVGSPGGISTQDHPRPPLLEQEHPSGFSDVCLDWWCGEGRECRASVRGVPECVCRQDCGDISTKSVSTKRFKSRDEGPVCGSDGLVYSSSCQLHRTACLTDLLLFVDTSPNGCRRTTDQKTGRTDFGNQEPPPPPAVHPNKSNPKKMKPPKPGPEDWKDEEEEEDWFEEDEEEYEEDEELDETSTTDEEDQKRLLVFREDLSGKAALSSKESSKSGSPGSGSVGPGSVVPGGAVHKPNARVTTTTTSSRVIPNPDQSKGAKLKRGSSLCSPQEYEILKEALLIYNQEHLIGKGFGGKQPGKDEDEDGDYDHLTLEGLDAPDLGVKGQKNEVKVEKAYLLSLMFARFDKNHNGALDYSELQKIGFEEKLGRFLLYCHPVDFLHFDDTDRDRVLSLNEFYFAFNKPTPAATLEEKVEVIEMKAEVGERVQMTCDLLLISNDPKGSNPSPKSPGQFVWSRYDVDLSSNLLSQEEQKLSLHSNGQSLVINGVELLHAGNYSCHQIDDKKGRLLYILSVQTPPDVMVRPHMVLWEKPGQEVDMECRARGEPLPSVEWLKNDAPLPSEQIGSKYEIVGDGIRLRVKDINFSDTGAYMCQARNSVGKRIDIASLLVIDEQTLPPIGRNETEFVVFHEKGISAYDPTNCRLQHQILSTDIIPGTQRDYICGSICEWGRGIRVSSVYVYVSQPKLSRILVISISQMVVVDVVPTDPFPVQLHYLPQVDQIWVECWKGGNPGQNGQTDPRGKTIQVIRNGKEKRKHRAIHPKGLDKGFDDLEVKDVFLPPDLVSSSQFSYGYITHKDTRGLYKVNLRTLRYEKSVDLSAYNCLPQRIQFSALYGFIIVECKEPVLETPTGQLVLDALSDAVIGYQQLFRGQSLLSPDSRKLVTWVHHPGGTSIILQLVKQTGLQFSFDVKTSLNISDVAFFPSQRFHSYDLFATSVNKEDVLFLELQYGKVELVPGVGRSSERSLWKRPARPIQSQDLFGRFLVTPSNDALFVLNGPRRTVNCEVGGIPTPSIIVWL